MPAISGIAPRSLRDCIPGTPKQGTYMLNWTITFLVIALIAALLGFTGIAGTAIGFAKILFLIFLVLFLVSFIAGRKRV